MNVNLKAILGEVWRSTELYNDFEALCACGGRLCGTDSEKFAYKFLVEKLKATGAAISSHECSYSGWRREHAQLQVIDGKSYVDVPTTSLLESPNTPEGGLELDVVDVGRGSVEEFQGLKHQVAGRAALARHEFFFSQTHVPRRRKYALSKQFGAKAFLIANYIPGAGIVNGVAGRGTPDDIPSVGMSYETGEWITRLARQGRARVRIEVQASRHHAVSKNIIVEIPGRTDEWVVLSAHYDGQHLGQSAMDNGSGAAAVLEVFRTLVPHVPNFRRGLRVIFFTLEHWGLLGSSLYVQNQPEAELRKIALAINLDTVGGGRRLSALTSGLADVGEFVRIATANGGVPINIVRALQINSDHYNFYLAGVPSIRLIAGFEDPESNTRFMMSAADTCDKVEPSELLAATMTTVELTVAACNTELVAKHRRPQEVRSELDMSDPWVSDRVNG